MKKLTKALTAGIGCILLVLTFCVPAFAEAQLSYVTDGARLLTDSQRTALEKEAESISEQYECGVYILTLDDFTAYADTNDVEAAAKAIYQEYDLGYGNEKSGVLLLLSMADRDYALIAYGYGNTAFTDYGKEHLAEVFRDNFAEDDWNGGLADYLSESADMLKSARAGKPLDVQSNSKVGVAGFLISLVLGCAVSGVVCLILRQSMRSVATGEEADAYIPAGSIAITRREDLFTHATEVRTKIEKKSSDSGGTTVDSDGFSADSGKF